MRATPLRLQNRADSNSTILIPFVTTSYVCRAFENPHSPASQAQGQLQVQEVATYGTPNFQAEKIQRGLVDRDKPVRSSLSLCLSESFPSLMSLDKFKGLVEAMDLRSRCDELTKRD